MVRGRLELGLIYRLGLRLGLVNVILFDGCITLGHRMYVDVPLLLMFLLRFSPGASVFLVANCFSINLL